MCGRYSLYQTKELSKRFKVAKEELDKLLDGLRESYNVAPAQREPVVVNQEAKNHLAIMKWGLIPVWAKDPNMGYKLINARDDKVFESPMWKGLIRHNRCIVPSNGFYEWKATGTKTKTPFFIRPKDQELFGFAGMHSTWRDVEGVEVQTYTIITTRPNKDMEDIHNRMPVILHPEDEGRWLDPASGKPEDIADLLKPYEDGKLEIYEVSRDVNVVRNNESRLILPINSQ